MYYYTADAQIEKHLSNIITRNKVKQWDSPKDFLLFSDVLMEENGFQKAPKNCRIKGREGRGVQREGKGRKRKR